MYLRCTGCRATNWVPETEQSSFRICCKRCGREYRVEGTEELGSRSQQEARALGIAESNRIDMASAYSVLFGFMTLEQAAARPVREDLADGPTTRTTLSESTGNGLRYDPGFRDAVEAGRLSMAQAIERGNRQVWASRVATLHGLSPELAYRVADNELSIRDALRRSKAEAAGNRAATAGKVSRNGLSPAVWLVIAALVVVLGAALAFRLNRQPSARPAAVAQPAAGSPVAAPPAADAPRVERDADGRVRLIEGPDAGAVLAAFCSSVPNAERYSPGKIVPAVPPSPDVRLGILHDSTQPQTPLAIQIRRDRGNGRWVAGDGVRPVAATVAPRAALQGQIEEPTPR